MPAWKRFVSPIDLLVLSILVNMRCILAIQSFELTRETQDKMKNPTCSSGNGKTFCENINAKCDWSTGRCCYCVCEYRRATFDVSTLRCRPNLDFRKGCGWRFKNIYDGQPLMLLDLSRKRDAEVVFTTDVWDDKVKSCDINSINMFLNDGKWFPVNDKLLEVDGVVEKHGEWIIDIEWDKKQPQYHGMIFNVSVTCDIERKSFVKKKGKGSKLRVKKTECFVFKSSGKITVSPQKSSQVSSFRIGQTVSPTSSFQPVEPHLVKTTPVLSSPNIEMTTMGFETEMTLSVIEPSLSVTLVKNTKVPKPVGKVTIKVATPSLTSLIAESSKYYVYPKARKESDGDKTVIISSVVGICVLVVVAVLLLILWSRKRKEKTSAQRGNPIGLSNIGTTADNNNAMPIYAEADNFANSKCVGEIGNGVYQYADNNVDKHYTSLDKTIPQEKSCYQPLTTTKTNLYEQIPQKKPLSEVQVRGSGMPSITGPGNKQDEQVHNVLEVDNKISAPPVSEAIYSEVNDYSEPGNVKACGRVPPLGPGNRDERVYSVLEEEIDPRTPVISEATYSEVNDYSEPGNVKACGRVQHLGPGNRDERVYSVLEEETDPKTPAISEAIYDELDNLAGNDEDSKTKTHHVSEAIYHELDDAAVPTLNHDEKHDEQVYRVLEDAGNGDEAVLEDNYLVVLHTE